MHCIANCISWVLEHEREILFGGSIKFIKIRSSTNFLRHVQIAIQQLNTTDSLEGGGGKKTACTASKSLAFWVNNVTVVCAKLHHFSTSLICQNNVRKTVKSPTKHLTKRQLVIFNCLTMNRVVLK